MPASAGPGRRREDSAAAPGSTCSASSDPGAGRESTVEGALFLRPPSTLHSKDSLSSFLKF